MALHAPEGYLGEAIHLSLTARGVTQLSGAARCPVTVRVEQADALTVTPAEQHADLLADLPEWTAVPSATGRHVVVVTVASDQPCVRPRAAPQEYSVPVTIDVDRQQAELRRALRAVAANATITVRQDHPLTAGRATAISVEVAMPSPPAGLKDVDVTLEPVGLAAAQPRDVRPYAPNVAFTVIATAPSAHDVAATVQVTVAGEWLGRRIETTATQNVVIDVRPEPWLAKVTRFLTSLKGIVTTVVAIVVTLLGLWRKKGKHRSEGA